MTEQSNELQLADALDLIWAGGIAQEAASKLRLLVAQRKALLDFAKYVEAIDPGNPAPLFEKARAAIKVVEDEK